MPKAQVEKYDVIVAGGGAAGMTAAGTAAARGKRVLLLEKNAKLGEKLAISGGKRCNILNAQPDEKKLLASYGSSEQFLYSAFSKFGMRETYEFFEANGLPLKVEARNRAFPQSEKAVDVVTTLRAYLAEKGVQVKLRSPVECIKRKGNRIESIEAGGKSYSADSYIFATGGLSHPETGSTGDGFKWLKDLGHSVETPTPTIVPLKVKEGWVKDLAGVAVDAKVTFSVDGVRGFSKTGSILFTHTGISGPTILNSSGKVAGLEESGEVTASIDLFPSTDLGTLDRNLTDLFEQNKNKALKNVLKGFVPAGMNDVLLELHSRSHLEFQGETLNVAADAKVHSVTKEQRRALVELLKNLPLTITGLMGFDKAVVADGGVPLTEIDMRTMRSLKVDNLFVVGDLLHISRPSGGYSLQLCWTTGFVAGQSV
jgi:predicted Rossmann fold flavoprotein